MTSLAMAQLPEAFSDPQTTRLKSIHKRIRIHLLISIRDIKPTLVGTPLLISKSHINVLKHYFKEYFGCSYDSPTPVLAGANVRAAP
ncbi:hypothetical protein [Stutzerimonas azotifigens]|uniref:Uncharacterized protein n=1 Tax=Stutzerimonas azotifigens TaxID=291995 RepID=A0ABR5Z6Z4_9GAMM|nr:hypothetical protein [Stutzerimonas azotifigens]MBA1275911.1 hypothetical protein [Stutzerimonas azotifigens]